MASQALVPAKSKSQSLKDSETGQSGSSQETTPSDQTTAQAAIEATDKLMDDIDKLLDQNAIKTLREQLDSFDPKEEKPYSLADAMREGATCTDQAIGSWVGQKGETCALSAAMLAVRARGLA